MSTHLRVLLKVQFICAIALLFALATLQEASAQERRVALLVGVADYQTLPPLKNTVNDTRLLATTLEALDFEVTTLIDPGLEQMRAGLNEFAYRAETADLALVYFAGHGMEVGGENLLVAADSTARSRQEVASGSVSLGEVLGAVDRARQLRIVILDSCRDDPFRQSGEEGLVTLTVGATGRAGLAPASPERGTLVAFAAEAGEVALDGQGGNSPFAMALAEHLATPDLEIGLMFRRVRDAVLRRTENSQEPHTYGSLSGNPFFLAGTSREVNVLAREERRNAWAVLAVDQEEQLAALAGEGDTRALKGLAYMRLDPNEERYDPEEAVRLLGEAAGKGDPEAQFELARLHEQGVGTEQDVERALELYNAAAEAGFADAINDLGFLHFQGGLGIVRDPKKGLAYFERAAELRHPEAMFNFAALIDDGIVDGKTPEDAGRFLYEALRSGNEDVLKQLSDNPNMFKPATREAVQRRLAEQAYYEGSIDGQFGPQTRRGLRKAYGLSE